VASFPHEPSNFFNMHRPKALKQGAVIGIISPASPQRDEQRLARGIAYLESLGYRIELGRNAAAVFGGYLAGTDEQRLDDFHAMMANPAIDAVFCARGGYGTPRLLDRIDLRLIRRNPKIVVGFSDITALQLALWRRLQFVTFSGMLPSVDFADDVDAESEEWFWRVLTSTKPLGVLRQSLPLTRLRAGDATGVLIPGNLSMISSTLGTPFSPRWKGAVVVLEDVGEETYRIDRMLTQLRLAGVFRDAAAVGFGMFTQKGLRASATPHRDVHDVLRESAAQTLGPVVANVMYGHETKKLTLPVGVRARIATRMKGIQLLDAGVQ
jgi:muramoyltetrapeptide carboxypeptidase